MSVEFRGWRRPAVATVGAPNVHGRLATTAALRADLVDASGAPAGSVPANVPVELLGPVDVSGLAPAGIRTVMPRPGTVGFETTRCPYVELVPAELPWRYTPEGNLAAGGARPWLALVVGTADELVVLPDGRVQLSAALTADVGAALASSWRRAHLQRQDGVELARIACERALVPATTYTAALVPAFGAAGRDAWTPGFEAVVASYHRWSFTTAEDVQDFQTLAAALHPQSASGMGVVDVRYRGHADQTLPTRGALTTLASSPADLPLPADVAADLAARRAVGSLPVRPSPVGMPVYGDVWADPAVLAPVWLDQLNVDPRRRLVSGLGVQAGIAEQDLLLESARTRWGDTLVAAHRVRHLAFGLAAAGSLWRRRLPVAPERRLLLYGPALARIVTDIDWSVLDLMTMPSRPLSPAFFSGAGARARRRGTARRPRAGGVDPADLLRGLNVCPVPPADPKELPDAAGAGRVLAGQGVGDGTSFVDQLLQGRFDPAEFDRDSLARDLRRLPDGRGDECGPVDLSGLVDQLDRAIDPTGPAAPARQRVLGPIFGLDDPVLAPVEPCADLDLPAWRFVRDHAKRWLLPGAEHLEPNGVTALATNPLFVDAYLIGLNQQTVGELRWRNLPVRSGCTPVRRFWDMLDQSGVDHPDVVGMGLWPYGSTLGDGSHQPPGAPTTRFVVVLRTPLFRRYPDTLIYLVPADVDLSLPPPDPTAAVHIPPVFVGEVERDVPFFGFPVPPGVVLDHWVVIEQVPHGYQFANLEASNPASPQFEPGHDSTGATDGGDWARRTFVAPVRVFLDLADLSG